MPALLKCDNSITIRFIYYKLFTLYIFKELGILDIFKINYYLTAMFMFRYHRLKNLPEVFENYFLTNNQIHQYNTRNASKLYKCYKRTNYVKHSQSNKGIDIWNSLEPKFKGTNSYNVFKKEMKHYFLLNPV